MDSPRYSRYVDALLILSLKVTEREGEGVIATTSCISSTVLNDLVDMGFIEYAQGSGDFVFTEKGSMILDQVKQAPWGAIDIFWSSPTIQPV